MKLAKMNFIVDISAGIFVYYPYSPDLPSGSFLEMDKKTPEKSYHERARTMFRENHLRPGIGTPVYTVSHILYLIVIPT